MNELKVFENQEFGKVRIVIESNIRYVCPHCAERRRNEEKKKAEFKPYLTFDGLSDFYGNIGDETSQVDVLGNRLKVGDTVKLYYGKTFKGESPIVRSNNRDFVMGLCGTVFFNGKAEDWTIIKNRSYEEVEDGEIVGNIKYIKNDPSKGGKTCQKI